MYVNYCTTIYTRGEKHEWSRKRVYDRNMNYDIIPTVFLVRVGFKRIEGGKTVWYFDCYCHFPVNEKILTFDYFQSATTTTTVVVTCPRGTDTFHNRLQCNIQVIEAQESLRLPSMLS